MIVYRAAAALAAAISSYVLVSGVLVPSRTARAEPGETISSPADSPPVFDSAARTQRQQIISELDRKVAQAKRDYRVTVDIVPALRSCAPLDASIDACQAAADRAGAELDRKIEIAARKQASASQPTAAPQYNVTIIDQRENYIINREPRPKPHPEHPGQGPGLKPGQRPGQHPVHPTVISRPFAGGLNPK